MHLKYYITIIIVSLIALFTINIFVLENMKIIYVFAWEMAGFFAVVGVDIIVAVIIHALPRKLMNPFYKRYKVFKWEKSFYEHIGIKKWKDYIPETGAQLCNLGKSKVDKKSDNEYLYMFLEETIYAEIMHFISAFLGLGLIFVFPNKLMFSMMRPIMVINFLLQLPPAFIQRYNRPRLLKLYEFNKRHKKTEETV